MSNEPSRAGELTTERPASDADESYALYRTEDRSLSEIASELLGNASTLIRQEVALAKAEAKESANRARTGVGLLAGAAVASTMVLFALTLALWWGLSVAIGTRAEPALGLGGLAAAGVWAIAAVVLGIAGKSALDKIKGIPMTRETVQKIPNAAIGHEEEN